MREARTISSRDNQYLKLVRRVRDRKEPDHIFVEGRRLCAEAVSSAIAIDHVFVSDRFTDPDLGSFANKSGRTFIVEDRLFSSIADTDSPQGIIMLARRPAVGSAAEALERSDRSSPPVWVFLENPNNPSNVGAVIRTAEAAGAMGVILVSGSVDPFSPKALRASMGSAFRFPIAAAKNVQEVLVAARSKGISIAAMDAGGSRDHLEIDWTKPTLLVVGGEAAGLSKETIGQADCVVRIAMKEPVESLNLAVSAGIVLFEAVRQNG